MAQVYKETILELPEEVIKASCGFSFDIGGSLAKVVYRSRDDYEQGVRKEPQADGAMGKVRMQVIPRDRIDDVIKIIKEKCDVTKGADTPWAYTTGVGASFFKKKVEEETGVSTRVIVEMDCFIRAFVGLVGFKSRDQLFLPEWEGVQAEHDWMKDLIRQFSKIKTEDLPETRFGEMEWEGRDGHSVEEFIAGYEQTCPGGLKPDQPALPCLLIMCGSGFGVLQVGADGDYAMTGLTLIGGRMFLGLCAALTGVKDYASLEGLIQSGTGRSVDVFTDEVKAEGESDGGLYSSFPDDMPLYCFAKAVTESRESLKPDDMVVSLLRAFSENIVGLAMDASARTKIKNIYFCGHFAEIERARQFMSSHIVKNSSIYSKPGPRFEFVRDGGMMGALGAFMEPHRLQVAAAAATAAAK